MFTLADWLVVERNARHVLSMPTCHALITPAPRDEPTAESRRKSSRPVKTHPKTHHEAAPNMAFKHPIAAGILKLDTRQLFIRYA